MEGTRELQISVEYQIYCLFYCLGSCLKFKPCCQIWGKFKWINERLVGELSLITREKNPAFLSPWLHRLQYADIS